MKVEYHPAIKHELQEIVKYYNRCSQGLGKLGGQASLIVVIGII